VKKRVGPIVPLMILIILGGTARAQERPFPYTLGRHDLVMVPASVGLSKWSLAEVRRASGLITLSEIGDLQRDDVFWLDRSATSNWSYRWGELSDDFLEMVVLSTVGIGVYEVLQHDLRESATMGVMFLETLLIVHGVTNLTKAVAGRLRPFVYNTGVSDEERYNRALKGETSRFDRFMSNHDDDVSFSFFSGHTSAAFAMATFTSTVFNDLHGPSTWSRLVWGSTLTFAALTAYARVKAGAHYPTDVIVGAIVGGAIGHLVPVMHRKGSSQRLTLGLLPDRVCLRLCLGSR